MPLAQRIETAVPYNDPLAQAFASRNEAAFDRHDSGWCIVIVCLLVVAALMLGAYAVAHVPGAQWCVIGLGALIFADVFAEWCDEARNAEAIR